MKLIPPAQLRPLLYIFSSIRAHWAGFLVIFSDSKKTDLEDFGGERSPTPTFANEREEQESWFETYTFKKDLDVPKEWECDLCNKSFTQAGNLKRHKRIVHEGRKGYECDICKKTYREVQSLKVHIKCVHEGIREYQCAFCDKLCSTKSSLKTHVINNHATVPIKKRDTKIACRICGIVFCHRPDFNDQAIQTSAFLRIA